MWDARLYQATELPDGQVDRYSVPVSLHPKDSATEGPGPLMSNAGAASEHHLHSDSLLAHVFAAPLVPVSLEFVGHLKVSGAE